MPRKTKIIFITVFILVGAGIFGYYLFAGKKSDTAAAPSTNPSYNAFNGLSEGGQLPTGNTGSTTGSDQSNNPPPNTSTQQAPSKFHQITSFAVAGATFFEDQRPLPQAQAVTEDSSAAVTATPTPAPVATTKGKTTAKATPAPKPAAPLFEIVPSLRYVERATGHIYELYLDTKIQGEVSNSTIPDIYQAMFSGDAKSVIYRYLSDDDKTIESYVATLGSTTGSFLPENILDASLSPDKTKFFYLTKTGDGVTGTIKSFDQTKTSAVFNSSFDEWLSQWVTDQKVYLTTKASATVEGDLYSLNTSTGTLSKVFGGVKGLTTLANNDGTVVLYSMTTGSGPSLGILTTSNHTTINTNTYGLPEKCVWSSDNVDIYCAIPDNISGSDYPDSWYKGQTSFDDRFVKINSSTGDVTTIADSSDGTPLDGTYLFLNKDESQLFFINKKDSTLWELDLN